jgi:hypothetical protein
MAALGTHQVDRGIAAAGAAVCELADASLLGLDARATGEALVSLARLESQVAELRLRVLSHAGEVHVQETTGATTPATWLASATRVTVRAARRATVLAEALGDYELLRTGMAEGSVNVEQAHVIVRALDALPAEVPTWVRVEAEQALVHAAGEHDAVALRILGDRILHLVAPEVGEVHEAKALADAEREAERATTLTMTPDGSGKVHGRFTLPELHAAMLRKMLTALVVHDRPAAEPATDEDADEPAAHQRGASSAEMGQAFCELLERLDGRGVPDLSSGAGPTVVVTMTLETLQGGLAAATLDTGDRIAAHTARRLACEAGIIPVVLGGRRKVLDVGRRQRLFTAAQRIALLVRDGGCTTQGCQTAAWFCHAHHDDPWSHGGKTDLANGRLLCPSHHRMAHDPKYERDLIGNNRVRFALRTLKCPRLPGRSGLGGCDHAAFSSRGPADPVRAHWDS